MIFSFYENIDHTSKLGGIVLISEKIKCELIV